MNPSLRRTVFASAITVALLATLAPAEAAGPPERPATRKLANGLRVVVFPRPGAGFVQVQLTVDAGTAAEGTGQRGAAPLVARLLESGGTASRTPAVFGADVDRFGGSFVASANRENAAIGAAFLPEDAEAGLELVSDAVINPIFDADALEKTRTQAVRELVRLHGDPVATAEEQLWRFAMPDLPGAREPLGDLTSLFALSRESLRNFHRDTYRPDRAVLAITGDVTEERAFAWANEWFARWAGTFSAPSPAGSAPRTGTRILLIDRPTLPVASVCLGWRVPGRDADDDLARTLGVSLFDEALTAKLAGRLPRDASLAVAFGQMRSASLLDVRFLVPPDSAAAAIGRVRAAVKVTRDAPPDAKRLMALAGQARAAYPMRFAGAGSAVAQWLAADMTGHDPDATLAEWPRRVAELDGEAVATALRRDWDLDRTAIVVVGPAAKLRVALAKIGTVTEAKLDEPPAASAADAAADTLKSATPADVKLGRERVAKAVDAHGGLEKLRGIRDMVSEARIRLVIQGRELRGELKQVKKEPLKMVYLTSFESFESRQVLNGDHAWSMSPAGRLQDSDSIGVRALQSGFSSDLPHLLIAASDPKSEVVDRGLQKVGTQDLQAVDVTARGGQRRRLYFDPATSRLVGMDQNEESARTARLIARRLYRDMRSVDGVLLPFEEERQLEGQTVMQVFVTKLTINTNVPEEEFKRPASAPTEPAKH